MSRLSRITLVVFSAIATLWAADIPPQRLSSTIAGENNQSYYWQVTPVAHTAELLTLFCRSCPSAGDAYSDQPLVAVLRDTLGDADPENDRVTDVWLLTYSRLNLLQRALSAVPFFYWHVGQGSASAGKRDIAPLFDLTAPQRPVLSETGRDILQWTMLDPMTTPVRASSRAYRTNQLDHERLHLEEAISYLRRAPVSDAESSLTEEQLDTIIARLELRKRLLGGLASETRAAKLGAESGFEQERIRSRNWELLRQCAEKTSLVFEPLRLGGSTEDYAILWFPVHGSAPATGTSLAPIWKLLNIRDAWSDARLQNWKGPVYARPGMEQPKEDATQWIPLAVYGLNYPKLPLLLVDFRDKLHVRWHEMTQRSINEITAGVIGISHFTNWYYYVAADLYDFVATRHGSAMNQAARLDCYSQFRVALALDRQLDPELRRDMQRRVDALALNPMEAAPSREFAAARARYRRLETETQDGKLTARLDKQRRYELTYFAESRKAQITEDVLHDVTLGLYTHRARKSPQMLRALDAYRRVDDRLRLLDSLVESGTQPEVAYDATRIQGAVAELTTLLPAIRSSDLRAHAAATLLRLESLSRDEHLRGDCSVALLALRRGPPVDAAHASGVVAARRGLSAVSLENADSAK